MKFLPEQEHIAIILTKLLAKQPIFVEFLKPKVKTICFQLDLILADNQTQTNFLKTHMDALFRLNNSTCNFTMQTTYHCTNCDAIFKKPLSSGRFPLPIIFESNENLNLQNLVKQIFEQKYSTNMLIL